MKTTIKLITSTLLFVLLELGSAAHAVEPVDLDMINRIRDEGFNRSQVMETLRELTDEIGARLTASPTMIKANQWSRDRLSGWGIKNAHLEGTEFGRGWSMGAYQVIMTEPRRTQLDAKPLTWYPGTNGLIEGEIIYAPMNTEEDFDKFSGKLRDKIVLVSTAKNQLSPNGRAPRASREERLMAQENYAIPKDDRPDDNAGWIEGANFGQAFNEFLRDEGALAIVQVSSYPGAIIGGSTYNYQVGNTPSVPGVEMIGDHYNRLVRLIDAGKTPRISLNVEATYHDEDTKSYSTIAEIPGQGDDPEIVMIGAHLDTWALGDGATDNGAGVATTMEALRILEALGVKPKRTIRIGLWGGEEQGYFGSHAYVMEHLASRPISEDQQLALLEPYLRQIGRFPIETKPAYDKFSAYYNLDNGSGKILGIYAQSNVAVQPIFAAWLKPFHDLGAKTVSPNVTKSTDHESFDDVGLPGFQFIQDVENQGVGGGHTQMDNYERVYEQSLKQASVIMASFLYHTAMREERLPRKPMPQQ